MGGKGGGGSEAQQYYGPMNTGEAGSGGYKYASTGTDKLPEPPKKEEPKKEEPKKTETTYVQKQPTIDEQKPPMPVPFGKYPAPQQQTITTAGGGGLGDVMSAPLRSGQV